MGYLHIDNLYKTQDILLFKECYALEKIHGTSTHVAWKDGKELTFFAGGNKHDAFVAIFDQQKLKEGFEALGHPDVTVYGEGYGGKCQGMSKRYGSTGKFIAFDVMIDKYWLSVPDAEEVVKKLGLEFVYYTKVPTNIEVLNAERDAPSAQAKRNGIVEDQPREGVVLRPLAEFTKNNGGRIIAKHRRPEDRETKTPRDVSPEKLIILTEADSIATEWVTPTRLQHVLDAMAARGVSASSMEHTKDVISAMTEDVLREGAGELVDSKEARAAIGKLTSKLFKAKLS